MNTLLNQTCPEKTGVTSSPSTFISKTKKPKQQLQKEYIPSKDISNKQGRYHWSQQEQKKYVNFLITRRPIFEMPINDRKSRGVHTKMSKIIKSRSSCQCRSHHQKMLVKYGSIDNILNQLRDLITAKNLKGVTLNIDQTQLSYLHSDIVEEVEVPESMKESQRTLKDQESVDALQMELVDEPRQKDVVLSFFQDLEQHYIRQSYLQSYQQQYPVQFFDFSSDRYEGDMFIPEFQ